MNEPHLIAETWVEECLLRKDTLRNISETLSSAFIVLSEKFNLRCIQNIFWVSLLWAVVRTDSLFANLSGFLF